MPGTNAIAPQDIAAVIDELAARIKADGNADILGIWAVARLAAGLNLTCAVAPAGDPEEAVVILGDALVEAVTAALHEHPEGRHQVLDAVRGVVERVLEALQEPKTLPLHPE
ncbi:MAG: hypothetical protein AMXMBFR64_39710 [Myxococcales bacterium]